MTVTAAIVIGGEHLGEVSEFDDHTGLGTIAGADGRSYGFHCTQVLDGSRHIEAGTAVRFVVGAGAPGRWEAFDVQPRD